MTTPEQAALLAKHGSIECQVRGCTKGHKYCESCKALFPCDVHRMAELKDAEIAGLRAEIERLKNLMDETCPHGYHNVEACFSCVQSLRGAQ